MVPHTAAHGNTSMNAVSKQVNTVPSGTIATLQAPTRHCFSAGQPASPPPAPCMHAHIHYTCNTGNPRWNRLQLFLPHQLFKWIPQHQCLWHPMPHLYSHEDLAMPGWHQDAWSRKSRNYQPRLSMDLVVATCYHIHPSKLLYLNHHVPYSQKGRYCIITHFISQNQVPRSADFSFAVHIYQFPASHSTCRLGLSKSKDYVYMFQCFLINVFQVIHMRKSSHFTAKCSPEKIRWWNYMK